MLAVIIGLKAKHSLWLGVKLLLLYGDLRGLSKNMFIVTKKYLLSKFK